ncbi:hypothetical protein AVEN_58798-1, partial [Araneus ventricosus]
SPEIRRLHRPDSESRNGAPAMGLGMMLMGST